jgi:pyruvate formate lyase activating enzyme
VRFNRGGTLFVPWNYFGALAMRSDREEALFSRAAGYAGDEFRDAGCDLHCGYCQNWVTSQALARPDEYGAADPDDAEGFVRAGGGEWRRHSDEHVQRTADHERVGCGGFQGGAQTGLHTSYVSNGNGTDEVLDYIQPWVDFYKVDLKGFDDKSYRQLGGKLDNVLKTIQKLYEKGFWVEIVTLFVPGFNDSENEMRGIAKFLAGVSRDIPWHCTAFHPDYKMTDRDYTVRERWSKPARSARKKDCDTCTRGTSPGGQGDWENTRCPNCSELLVERAGFMVHGYHLTDEGKCPKCATPIPGRWDAAKTRAALGRFTAFDRIPHAVRSW